MRHIRLTSFLIVPLILLAAPAAEAAEGVSLEHYTGDAFHNSLFKIDADTYLLAYSSPAADGNGAYVQTFTISADGSSINKVQKLRHSTIGATGHNGLAKRDTNTYVLAYANANDAGCIQVFNISDSGSINKKAYMRHDETGGKYNSFAKVDAETFALAYTRNDGTGVIKTFYINSSGDTIEQNFELVHASNQGEYNSLVKVQGDIYALAYTGNNDTGRIKTFYIDSDGDPITTVETLVHASNKGLFNSFVKVDANIFALAYTGGSNVGRVKTFNISDAGAITDTHVDFLDYAATARNNSLVHVDADTYAVAFADADQDGNIRTFTIGAAGAISNSVIDSLEHDTVNGQYNSLVQMAPDTLALAYTGAGNDGYIKTFVYSCPALSSDGISIDSDPVCEGVAQTFTVSTSGDWGTVNAAWDFDEDGQYDDCLTNPCSTTFPLGDDNTVGVEATDSCPLGGRAVTATTTATVETQLGTPAAPGVTDLDACAQSGVRITWGDVLGATGYDLFANPPGGATTGVTSPYTHDPGDTLSHNYRVRANNACTGDWSDLTSFSDGDATPAAPAAPVVSDVDDCAQSGVEITWGTVPGLTYDLRVDSGAIVSPVTSPHPYDPGDTASHSYEVRAVDPICGAGAWSSPTSATDDDATIATPEAPAVSDLDDCAQSGVEITWGDAAGATSYIVRVDGTTVANGVTSPYTYDPGDTDPHSYHVRGKNDTCGVGSYSDGTSFSDGAYSFPYTVGTLNPDHALDLRSAINCANTDATADTIHLSADIALTEVDNGAAHGPNGLPVITEDLTIEGNGFTLSRDFAAPLLRILQVEGAGIDLTIRSLDLDGGDGTTASGGGAILSIGSNNLTVEDCGFTGNTATGFSGGAVSHGGGILTISNSLFQTNQAHAGGAVYGGDTVKVMNSQFINNQATGSDGGAVKAILDDTVILSSTFSGNTAVGRGGGLFCAGRVVNSTFVGNSADSGAGIQRESSPSSSYLTIVNSTVAGNSATTAGGGLQGEADLYNTIVSGNSAASGAECSGAYGFNTAQNNILGVSGSDGGCTGFGTASANITPSGDLSTVLEVDSSGDPLLTDNGGNTETVAVAIGGHAVDAGDALLLLNETDLGLDGDGDSITDDPIDYDQRGDDTAWPRVMFTAPDAGAFELDRYPIYVDIDATSGANNGSSWDDAYLTLQAALAVASAGDQVWIAEGVYYPATTFSIPNGVAVYGGFDGTEERRSQRDVTNNVVVLSGDVDGNDTNSDGNFIAETYLDIQGANAGPVAILGSSVILDGVTVTAGRNSVSGGGGIKCSGGTDPILRYLVVTGNYGTGNGGGVYECDFAVVESSLITGNYSDNNGGGWAGGGTFRDVVFSENEADGSVGALIANEALDMTRCTLVGNNGGAIGASAPLTMDTVLVSGNYGGAAIKINSYLASLNNMTITGNRTGSAVPGGVYFVGTVGTAEISNSIIWNNANMNGTGTLASTIVNDTATVVTVSNSIMQGSGGSAAWVPTDLVDGGNNKDANPDFVRPVNPADAPTTGGNSHLMSGSPAVDAGDNSHVTTTTDLDGEVRIQNGTVDMGAYEQLVADLAISKSDGVLAAAPGDSISYTIVASNSGPSHVGYAEVDDLFPAALTCSWTGSGTGGASGPASGSGSHLEEGLNLPSGSSFTFVAVCDIDPAATGTLSNTATISTPLFNDPDPGNNSATDDDTVLVPSADLAITKTDGVTSAAPGDTLTYTIQVSNAGPSTVYGAAVEDIFPSELTGCQWTCASATGDCTSGPVFGDIVATADLPQSSSATFTAICNIDPSATGTLSNTATISSAVTDPVPGNNSATDNNTVLTPEADLVITKDDGVTSAMPGDTLTYTIQVTNAGPSDVSGADVEDLFPDELTGCQWTCEWGGGDSCTAGPVAGDIVDTIDLNVSSAVTYTAICDVDAGASFSELTNTATVTAPAGTTDPDSANNSDSDTDLGPMVFADGFESGDTIAWSSTAGGSKRLASVADPGDELVIRLEVDLRRPGQSRVVGLSDSGNAVLALNLRGRPGELEVTMAARLDDGTWARTEPLLLAGDGPVLDLEWRRAWDPDSNTGEMYLAVDSATVAWLTDLDTDAQTVREVMTTGDLEVRLARE